MAVSGYIQEYHNVADLRVCAKASNSAPKIERVPFRNSSGRSPANTKIPLQIIDGDEIHRIPENDSIEAMSSVASHQHQITKTDVVPKGLDIQYTIGIASGIARLSFPRVYPSFATLTCFTQTNRHLCWGKTEDQLGDLRPILIR